MAFTVLQPFIPVQISGMIYNLDSPQLDEVLLFPTCVTVEDKAPVMLVNGWGGYSGGIRGCQKGS